MNELEMKKSRYLMHKRRSFYWFEQYRRLRSVFRLTKSDYDYALMRRAGRMYEMNREYADKFQKQIMKEYGKVVF